MKEDIWKKYSVQIQFRDKVLGGIPKSRELIEPWLKSRGVPQADAKELAEKVAEEVNAEEDIKKGWTGFKADEEGIYLEERQVKALLKETAKTLRLTRRPGFRDQVNHGAFVKPEKLYLIQKDASIKEPDGYDERPIHVMGPRGPRSALTRQDYVEHAEIEFELWVAKAEDKHGEVLPEKTLREMLTLGQELGLGASRSQGYGKFDVTEFKPIL